jgi:hypothetical protein
VSRWLNAGVPPTQVAEWAGHSVRVLLTVYAKCIVGEEQRALRLIDASFAAERDEDEPPDPPRPNPGPGSHTMIESTRSPQTAGKARRQLGHTGHPESPSPARPSTSQTIPGASDQRKQRAGQPFSSWRDITTRCIWLVPS